MKRRPLKDLLGLRVRLTRKARKGYEGPEGDVFDADYAERIADIAESNCYNSEATSIVASVYSCDFQSSVSGTVARFPSCPKCPARVPAVPFGSFPRFPRLPRSPRQTFLFSFLRLCWCYITKSVPES